MFRRTRRPTTPGEILNELYLRPRDLNITRFAEATQLTRKHVSNIVHGKAGITPETACRFAQVLDTTPRFWLNLQNAVDLHDAQLRLRGWRPAEIHPAESRVG